MRIRTIALSAVLATASFAEASTPWPTAKANPYYPDDLQQRQIEGWGLLSVRVTRAGAVDDAFVVDSSGRESVERALLAAVKQWRYAPRASDRCGVKLRLTLQHASAKVRASAHRYTQRFDAALARGDLAGAKAEIEDFDARSLKELSMREVMRAKLAQKQDDVAGEIIALNRAGSGISIPNSSGEGRSWATTIRNLELHALVVARQYGAAAGLAHSLHDEGALAPEFEPALAQLDALPTSSGRMETPGVARRLAVSADAPSHWLALLTRRRFRLEGVSGEIERAELCCDNASLEFEPGVDVEVPADAGACAIQVRGKEDARFTLTEFPNAAAESAAPALPAP